MEAERLAAEGTINPELVYVAEMRLRHGVIHPVDGEKVKTVCLRDMKDVLGPYSTWSLYWDRYDEGLFAGGKWSGKGMHIDQVLWSNVGKHWSGYKLVAAWPKGSVSKEVAEEFFDVVFCPPLSEREVATLHRAAKVVLLRPGDVYLFSGGVAHTVICVSDELCLGAYESIVTLNPIHVAHFLHTGDAEGDYNLEKFAMSPKELKETKEDILDQLEDAAEQFQNGGPLKALRPGDKHSATWTTLLQKLDCDEALQSALRWSYAQAVKLCEQDAYFRENMPRRVQRAAGTCALDEPSAKRLRTSPPCAQRSPSPDKAQPLETCR